MDREHQVCPACGQPVDTVVRRHKTLGAWVPRWVAGPCHNPDCEAYVEGGAQLHGHDHPERYGRPADHGRAGHPGGPGPPGRGVTGRSGGPEQEPVTGPDSGTSADRTDPDEDAGIPPAPIS
ncbi:hypothetical protein [Streptomyces sp. NPDC088812]|uniref:hypothetical protein n=1 Tax=Streptomyces sp. NPDC088812 TaxID=3365905 RepID=UPI0038185C79